MTTKTSITISVVIPTRNRPQSFQRLLQALARQERLPDEVVVVDASDEPLGEGFLRRTYPELAIRVLHMPPSVCAQRNVGIRQARGSHVLLCDDDIEPSPAYVGRLAKYLEDDLSAGAVSGVCCEPDSAGNFTTGFPVPSVRQLLFRFLFQLTVWGDVEATTCGWPAAPVLGALKRWYRHRDNTWSLAGWPLITQVQAPVVRTAFYALGTALVRRQWLLASPYDEGLGPHGIGDHYGVALGFPNAAGIAVLTNLPVPHHKVPDNRLDAATTYYQRVLALHYFLRVAGRFSILNTTFLVWSLIGNAVAFTLRGPRGLLRPTLRAIAAIMLGRNPLLQGVDVPDDHRRRDPMAE